jgi:hypothetical protein
MKTQEQLEREKKRRREAYAARILKNGRDRINEQARKNYHAKKSEYRNRQLRTCYGIELADYEEMFSSQNGMCAICHSPPGELPWERLHVDHCHTTGKVRGLLCRKCNTGVGNFADSENLLQQAVEYLKMASSSA